MNDFHLDVESLRTLLAVLDAGGMTKAAERLHLSQSAVSWKIKRLEERVGRPLLIRDGHHLRPTRDGRALVPDARTIVELHDRAVARLQSSDLTGWVKIGSNEEVDAARMASLLGRFKRAHPHAMIEFVVDSTVQLVQLLDTARIDIAVMQVTDSNLRPDDVVLWSDQLHWVTSWEAPFDDGVVPLITFGDECFYRALSEPLLTAAGIEFTIAFSAATTNGVRAGIEAGLGVGVLSSRHIGGEIVEWPRESSLPALPQVHQIARTVPGENRDAAAVLVDVLADELHEPSYHSERLAPTG